MLIWLKNQGKVRYRTFQLRLYQRDLLSSLVADVDDENAKLEKEHLDSSPAARRLKSNLTEAEVKAVNGYLDDFRVPVDDASDSRMQARPGNFICMQSFTILYFLREVKDLYCIKILISCSYAGFVHDMKFCQRFGKMLLFFDRTGTDPCKHSVSTRFSAFFELYKMI